MNPLVIDSQSGRASGQEGLVMGDLEPTMMENIVASTPEEPCSHLGRCPEVLVDVRF